MTSAVQRLTQDEMYDYLDENFDIPNDGVNSDIDGLDEDSLDEQDDEFAMQAANIDIVFVDEDDIDVNLAAVDIIENTGRGRPSNVSVDDFQWSCERGNVDIPSFSQAVGPTQVMPDNSAAVDFFQLFVDNRILGNIVRQTNRYARQSLAAKHKDPGSVNELSLEELKAFLGLLIGMSMHRLPCLRDYWSSDWILKSCHVTDS